ncbi:MAG: hypothetical protein NVS3B20_07700 [Polyangiales bacterium]
MRLGRKVTEDPSFTRLSVIPDACHGCPHREDCHGGCASRRALKNKLGSADEFCPIVRGRSVSIAAHLIEASRISSKASSACTTILRPRNGPSAQAGTSGPGLIGAS